METLATSARGHSLPAHSHRHPHQGHAQGDGTASSAAKYFDPIALGLHPPLGPLRLYVYGERDAPALRTLLDCEASAASSQGVLLEAAVLQRLSASALRTSDAFEADFFVVPARPACLLERGATPAVLNAAYVAVIESLPHFQQSGGRNHVFAFTSAEGPLAFPDW